MRVMQLWSEKLESARFAAATPWCCRVRVWLFAAFALGAQASQGISLPAYTNHAGLIVEGVPIALASRIATLSNASEMARVPLSIFPERERRRLVADYVALHPEAGTGLLLVPHDIRRAVETSAASLRRSQARAAKELCTKEQSEEFCNETRAVLRQYLVRQEASGRLLASERRLLEP